MYAKVVLPLNVHPLTFEVGEAFSGRVVCGSFVAVRIRNKIYSGIVWSLVEEKPAYKTNPIEQLLDIAPLSESQRGFWEWIAKYYLCSLGDVMRVAIPKILKAKGSSTEEFLTSLFKPDTKRIIRFVKSADEHMAKRKKRQFEVLQQIESLIGSAQYLLCDQIDASQAVLKALAKGGYISLDRVEVGETLGGVATAKGLSLQKGVTLLRSDNPTDSYTALIQEKLRQGKDVLVLQSEVVPTSRLVETIKIAFGDRVIIYHPSLTERARGDIFRRVSDGQARVVVGFRPALFLQLNLGLIIVDNEQDDAYKNDSSPRYNARDMAVVLGKLTCSEVLLSSASPSLESYLNAISRRYHYIEQTSEQMPRVVISDTIRSAKRGERNTHFNHDLINAIERTIADKKQVILFQNRRGYSPYIECDSCGWSATCPHCNVTLTMHLNSDELQCHYCGYKVNIPKKCPSCVQGVLSPKGFGTEKVEDELKKLFPDIRVSRLDSDTAPTKREAKRIINNFTAHNVDIMVGTQMINRDFDAPDLALVGVLNIDNLINIPDFRATEKTFATIKSLALKVPHGEVVIQTSQIDHPLIKELREMDYTSMAEWLLKEREEFLYPPYCRIIEISLFSPDSYALRNSANGLERSLRPIFKERLSAPLTPIVERIRGELITQLVIKIDRDSSGQRAKESIVSAVERTMKEFRNVRITIDVDPQ